MKSLRIERENMIKGKKYWYENKDRTLFGCLIVSSVETDGTLFVKNGVMETLMFTGISEKTLTFYTCPDDFYIKWNQQRHRTTGVSAIMGFSNRDNVAELCLGSGFCAVASSPRFSDIPNEPETIEVDGKTYNHKEVIERLKELKTVKE